jgi:ABC-2 type transport system ATP-binding protein
MTNSVVQARGLRVARGGVEILHSLDFDVPAGQVTGLLGPSGCGKTTLIRAVAGAQQLSGRLTVLDKPAGDPTLRRSVGYAAQTAAIYLDLTVAENLRYFGAVLGAPASDLERALDIVDLGSHRDRLVGRMSGGERSRVSLAVALLGEPRLLLLDEPTVGLDPVLRNQLWKTFAVLAADGMSLLVSSHVMDEAQRCDQLLLMREGVVLAQEPPRALCERTHSTDVEQAFLTLVGDAA